MKRNRIPRPSFGFLLLVGTHSLLVAFLVWGYSRPDLERGWYILQKMQRDSFMGLSVSDTQTLERLLQKHPQFSRALIGRNPLGFVEPTDDGWMSLPKAHAVVQASSGAPLRVLVDCRAPKSAYPVSVTFEMSGSREILEFAGDGQKVADWSTKASSLPLFAQVNIKPSNPGVGAGAGAEVRIRAAGTDSQKATSWQ